MARKDSAVSLCGIDGHDRPSLVTAEPDGVDQGHLPQERDPEIGGERRAPAGAEELVAGPLVAGEPAHVLDHAAHRQLEAARREGRTLRHPLRRRLRGRDDHDLGPGHHLGEGQRDVAGARWHVDEHEVRLAPVGIGEELLNRLVQHRTPPDDRLVVRHEVAHGEALDPVRRCRDHDVAQDDRVVVGPEHLGDREAIDVGVEQADAVAGLGQGDGEVHRDRRLADAALARRHPDDPGGGIGSEEGRHRRAASVPVRMSVTGVLIAVPVAVALVLRCTVAEHLRPANARGARPAPRRSSPRNRARPPRPPATVPAARWMSSARSSAPGHAATGRATSTRTRRRRVARPATGRGHRASGPARALGQRSTQPRAVIGLVPCTPSSRTGSESGDPRRRCAIPRRPSWKG